MNQLTDLLWLKLPNVTRRFWLTLSVVLGDGAYLRAFPPLAIIAPIGGFALGAFLGLIHPGTLYTYSFFVVLFLLAASSAGAAVGLWTWSGYVLVDLVITDRSQLPGFTTYATLIDRFTTGYVPLLMSYALLASLLVLGPLLGSGFAARTAVVVRRHQPELAFFAGQAIYVLVVAGFTFAWAQATPFMIRPLWSFAGYVPDTEAVQPIQSNTVWLALFAGFFAVVRSVVMIVLSTRPKRPSAVPLTPTKPPGAMADIVRLLILPLQALFVTLLLAGLVSNIFLGVLVWALITGILVARVAVVPLIPVYPDVVRKVPLLLRIGVCVLFSYLSTSVIVQPFVDRGERSFTPLVISIFLSFIVGVFLLPGQKLTFGKTSTPTASSAPVTPPPTAPGPPGFAQFGARASEQLRSRALAQFRGRGSARFGARALARRGAVVAAAVTAMVAVFGSPAFADNCSGLTDCSFGVKVALVVAAIAIIALAIFLLPEILGAAAVEGAIVEGAAVEGAIVEGAAVEGAIAEGAAVEGALAEGAAVEGAGAAAEGLSDAAMEEALAYANTESKLAHIIDPAKHGLGELVEAAGGRSEAMKAIVDSLASGEGLPAAGKFEVTRIIEGANVVIRGFIQNGVPKIGTAFIPPVP